MARCANVRPPSRCGELRLRRSTGGCELEIADDGRGSGAFEGSGLSGMRQRVEALGGTLERNSARGTRLIVRLPIVVELLLIWQFLGSL